MSGDGASLRRVQPAVRPPTETVHHRVRVFQAEAREMHLGIAVGHVVVVLVGIEQQVRRIEHPHTAAAARDGGDDVQPVEKRLVIVEDAVAVGVFVDRDLVVAALVVGWREGNLVVRCAPIVVAADNLQPGGRGYCRYCTTHSRPRSSKLMNTGWRTIGSERTRSSARSSGVVNRAAESSANRDARVNNNAVPTSVITIAREIRIRIDYEVQSLSASTSGPSPLVFWHHQLEQVVIRVGPQHRLWPVSQLPDRVVDSSSPE